MTTEALIGATHPLRANVPPHFPVSDSSVWNDPIWIFPPDTDGYGDLKLDWQFAISSRKFLKVVWGDTQVERIRTVSSLDPDYEHLLDLGRRFIWSIRRHNQRRGSVKNGTLSTLFLHLRLFLTWMASQNYVGFDEVTPLAASQFMDYIVDQNSGEDEALHKSSIASYADLLIRIYEQRQYIADHPRAKMADPFETLNAKDVARKYPHRELKDIRAFPDDVFLPVITTALDWLETPADVILEAVDHLNRWLMLDDPVGDVELVIGSFAATDAARNLASTRYFDADADLSDPDRLMALTKDLRSAATIVLLGYLGLRVNELCSLAVDTQSGASEWPSCVEAELSIDGVDELFFIRGRLAKGETGKLSTRWLAGSRPAGTTYVPSAIKAVQILEQLYRASRYRNGSSKLVFDLSKAVEVTVPTARHVRLRIKDFVQRYVELPKGATSDSVNTHRFRKTFAVHAVRADERLLTAVSHHFKQVSIGVTERHYVGMDAELLDIIRDAATMAAAKLIADAIDDGERFSGRMATLIADRREQITSRLAPSSSPEERLEQLSEMMEDDQISAYPSKWGKCFFRYEAARCHRAASRTIDHRARSPNYTFRQPELCGSCANLLVSPDHMEFWQRRHDEAVAVAHANEAAGNVAIFRAATARAQTAAAMLRRSTHKESNA